MLDLQSLIRGSTGRRQSGSLSERTAAGLPDQAGKGPVALLKTGFPRPALPEAKLPPILKKPSTWRLVQVGIVFLPTILSVLYFGFIASNRYVSQAQFVIRSGTKPTGSLSFGSLLQMTGIGQSEDDTYSVETFMTSRDAVHQLMQKIPLRKIYDRPGADFIARYPSLFYGKSNEEFYRYFQWMLDVVNDGNTGITTLRVEAFTPGDAYRVAKSLLALGEKKVNEMNGRIEGDAVRVAQNEVDDQQRKLVAAQVALTDFRTREMMIDPVKSALVMTGVIAKLSIAKAQFQAEVRATEASSPLSPQLPGLRRKVSALNGEIAQEQAKIAGPSNSLADKLATYQRLELTREFAKQALTTATAALQAAKSQAHRQQLYLDRVVEPNLPDYPTKPDRLRTIATVFAFNVIFLLVATTIMTGIREHRAGRLH